jgi:hypothetical protein
MSFGNSKSRNRLFRRLALVGVLMGTFVARGQGPAPETAPPLFPGGALVSYNSIVETRGQPQTGLVPTSLPTFSHEDDFNFTWGFHPNFDLTVIVPVVTNHFENVGASTVGGTGLGDVMALVTGQTGLTAPNGTLLPATLQPGSGSTDAFLAANWTYTGLFNIRRLVADEDFHSLLRTTGTQDTWLGSNLVSRVWLSYRPYEVQNGAREWFVGPDLLWLYSANESISGNIQQGSGGQALLAGITTYVGVRPGMHLWFGMDWDVAHSTGAAFNPIRRHISFGITQQFRLHL